VLVLFAQTAPRRFCDQRASIASCDLQEKKRKERKKEKKKENKYWKTDAEALTSGQGHRADKGHARALKASVQS